MDTTKDSPQGADQHPHQLPNLENEEFATLANLKWSRANSHFSTLFARFNEWLATNPVSIAHTVDQENQKILLLAEVRSPAPLSQLSLDLGDALHNLRSALDATAWGLATLNNRQPKRAKSVYYPICTIKREWQTARTNWVDELDDEMAKRLLALQPFVIDDPNPSPLKLLHDLDIVDKHRGLLSANVTTGELKLDGQLSYRDESGEKLPDFSFDSDVELADGAQIGLITLGDAISVGASFAVEAKVRLVVKLGSSTFEVETLAQATLNFTRACLDTATKGLPPDVEPVA